MSTPFSSWVPGTHYHVLDVPHDASSADIDAAYRRALARCTTATGRFLLRLHKGATPRDLAAAHGVLMDPGRRLAYDDSLRDLIAAHLWHPPCF